MEINFYKLQFASNDIISDLTGISYIIYPAPIFVVLDNGDIHATVGNGEDASFKISIDNGTNAHGVHVVDKAGANNHQAMTMDVDSANFNGVGGLNIFMSSSTGVSNITSNAITLEGDATGFVDSLLHYIDISLLGQGSGNDVDVIHITGLPDDGHIIHAGNPDDISKAYYDNTVTIADVTTAFGSSATNVALFENDNSIVYVGNTGNFTTIGFSLDTPSSVNIKARFFYCNSADNWVILPGVSDTTDGMQVSGTISFINPTDRGTCNDEIDGTAFADTTDYSYIAVKRLRNYVGTNPIESMVTIAGGGENFLLATDYMKLNPVDTAPETCGTSMLGAIYFDISEDDMCVCKSAGWFVMTDGSACT